MTWPTHDGETQADQEAYLEHDFLAERFVDEARQEQEWRRQAMEERWADEAVGDEAFEDLRARVDRGDYDDVAAGITVEPGADGEIHVTKTGRVLTDAEIEALADEAERGYPLRP